nr:glycoside hydrolase family 3 N-terminal domain-containing protein [uncultured Ruminococcus sp.]
MDKINNKIIISMLCIVLVLFFASCGKGNNSVKETTTSTTKAVETTSTASKPTTTVEPTTNPEENLNNSLDNYINQMTTEEKVGQMFYVRCPDTDALTVINKYHIGGYILFGKDFENKTKEEVTNTISSYQDEAKIPLLIGVDEEGGTVVRVSSNPELRENPFLSPKDTFANGGWDGITDDAKEKAELLLSLGINVNMAPDCDITSDTDGFMYDRSFSNNVDDVDKFVSTVVSISKENHLGTVLKHFPGYGNNVDTHTGIAYDNRDYSEFTEKDFKPFIAGINAGADCILVSHNIVNCMDKNYPASLSENVHKIIRNELNFDGVIMTDDLIMDAITQFTDDESAAVIATKAGNDLLCCSSVDTQYPAVLKAVNNNEIPMSQINASVKRILKWKINLGILDIDTILNAN